MTFGFRKKRSFFGYLVAYSVAGVLAALIPFLLSGAEMGAMIGERLAREPLHIGPGEGLIERIGWCTGAAQGSLLHAAELGLDAFLTGEVSEQTVHQARELDMHFFAAGHHATERYGIQALGTHLADRFNIRHQYIDIDNPA